MGSYLEAYGANEAHRAHTVRRWKIGITIATVALIGAFILYESCKNYREESIVQTFLAHLRNGEYPDAYRMWGCTEATPCRDYAFPKFMEDWGPRSPNAKAQNAAAIGTVQSCGNGALIQVTYPGTAPVALFVNKETGDIGFSPWAECPGKHWHFSDWWHSLWHH